MFFSGVAKFFLLMPFFFCTRRKTNYREMYVLKRGLFCTICVNLLLWVVTLVAEFVVLLIATVWRFNRAGRLCVGDRSVYKLEWNMDGPVYMPASGRFMIFTLIAGYLTTLAAVSLVTAFVVWQFCKKRTAIPVHLIRKKT